MRLEASRKAATVVSAFFTVFAGTVVVIALLYGSGDWPYDWPPPATQPTRAPGIVALVALGLVLLALGSTLVNGRRWHIHAEMTRVLEDPAVRQLLPDRSWTPQPSRVLAPPELYVHTVQASRMTRPRELARVTAEHNVLGRRPLRLAYLRLFENQPRSRTFIEGAWREFGYVHFLRSAQSVSPAEFRRLKRTGFAGAFVSSPAELEAALRDGAGPPAGRGLHSFREVAGTTVRSWDRYGGYPPVPLLCHGSFWRQAVDMLLDRMDGVLLDLSGFGPGNEGTGYELQRVIDRFPMERVVLLADGHSDLEWLGRTVQAAWERMATGSPNATGGVRHAVIAVTDYFQTTVQRDSHGTETSRRTRLVARRSETRALAAWLQDSVEGGPGRWVAPSGTGGARWPTRQVAAVAVAALALLAVGGGVPLVATSWSGPDPPGPPPRTAPDPPDPPTVGPTRPPVAVVPVLIGHTQREATAMLRALGLRVGHTRPQLSAEPAGTVLGSAPPADTVLAAGQAVDLALASGRNRVPDVVGNAYADAVRKLNKAGFQARIGQQAAGAGEPGTVVEQDPGPQPADLGSTVDLVVAAPPDPTPEPTTPSPTPSPTTPVPPTPTPTLTPTPTPPPTLSSTP